MKGVYIKKKRKENEIYVRIICSNELLHTHVYVFSDEHINRQIYRKVLVKYIRIALCKLIAQEAS